MPASTEVEVVASDVRSLVEALGQTSRFFTDAERRSIGLLSTSLLAFLEGKWRAIVEKARGLGAPVLTAYLSDGWSTELTQTRSFKVGDSSCRRVGRFRAAFLAEKALLK
eukprot:1889713-Alexandrium_andersonii.AAC.1